MRRSQLGVSIGFFVAAVAFASVDSTAQSEQGAVAEYDQLRALQFSPAIDVPSDHLVFEFEGATWRLEEGRLWLQRPLSSGAVLGFAFEGKARFVLDVPDAFELTQLRRFARDEELEGMESGFQRMFVRVAAPELVRPLTELAARSGVAAGPFASAPSWVQGRQATWILEQQHDADGRALAALATFGERYLRAAMKLEDHGWTTFSFDARQREEIELLHHTRANLMLAPGFGESWLRLDQASDRDAQGRPADAPGGFAQLEHFDAAVDLRQLGEHPAYGFGANHPIDAGFEVTARFRSRYDGLGALVLQLDPRTRISGVASSSGRALPLLRFPRGALANHLDKEWGNRQFVVLLEEPLRALEAVELRFSYELELANFAPGLSWHPNTTDFELQPFTASLDLLTRDYYDVLASGRRVEVRESEEGKHSRWLVDQPSRIVGFTFARYAHAARFEWAGVPPLTIFGTTGGYLSAQRIENLDRFFAQNLRCLVDLLGPPAAREMVVTLINAGHSQSFEGFLQVSEGIAKKGAFGQAIHGRKELHAAHELAHQWWGHLTKPDSYRDVWLSEALAEYTAGLCVRQTADDGARVFADMIEAFRHEVNGSTASAFNAFARVGLASRNQFERDRLPPIAHGARAAVRHNPFAVMSTVYRKGALVLHMIDELLRVKTGSREAFVGLLRSLLASGDPGQADPRPRLRTEDLELLLEEISPSIDWKLQFDQWVRAAEMPSWRVEQEVSQATARVRLRIEQRDAAPEFTSWVPVRASFSDGSVEERLVLVSGKQSELTLQFEQPLAGFEFNPGGAVPVRWRVKKRASFSSAAAPAAD